MNGAEDLMPGGTWDEHCSQSNGTPVRALLTEQWHTADLNTLTLRESVAHGTGGQATSGQATSGTPAWDPALVGKPRLSGNSRFLLTSRERENPSFAPLGLFQMKNPHPWVASATADFTRGYTPPPLRGFLASHQRRAGRVSRRGQTRGVPGTSVKNAENLAGSIA
jgi:hypothetical protein